MTLSSDKRQRLAELRREIAEITAETPEQRQARRARLKAQRQAVRLSMAPNKRQPRETDPGFLAWLRRQPCEAAHLGGCDGPIEAAHIRYSDFRAGSRNPGMQSKNHDRHANALCRHHHQCDQHKGNERAFWSRLGKDAYATAAASYAKYEAE